ncbi:MAG TPA: arsenite methyltransferase [Candidatus Saccharimonadaceae bacterium]|jgi:SAM-dependent methyltransferase|nr:arsenite methyltransferase [Candidatus Saccharimonadaceae bacterium]
MESIAASPCCTPLPGKDRCCDSEPATTANESAAAAHSASAGADSAADVTHAAVRARYTAAAEGSARGCCSTPEDAEHVLAALGYTSEQAAAIPEGANLGLGCGNPLAHAELVAGETVLDLGSGAGIDCFIAARQVGPAGRAIGVDMTPAMIDRARANARRASVTNVEFRLGEIEHLPVADGSVDAIVSNCVVNLSPDKPAVFREAWRVLRAGGRLLVSDLVWTKDVPDALKARVDRSVGCVAGASRLEDYLALLSAAGFRDVAVVERAGYAPAESALGDDAEEREAFAAIASVKVRAIK